ncbi:MAG: galactose mutarotase [Chloroflexi bacterium]|nr:galactose mutarotase [Chloroflexota bacterium]
MPLSHQPYGVTGDGQPVILYTLSNNSGVTVEVMNYGGIIRAIHVPDRAGNRADIALGFDTLEPYLGRHPFFGALVGRFANRIGQARFSLDGAAIQLAQNNGVNHLHGGVNGFDKKVWQSQPFQNGDSCGLRLAYTSWDGEENYPGTLSAQVTYTLTGNELRIDYTATTDKATILNLTNHAYFNLAGGGDILGHRIQLHADFFTPIDGALITTGEIRPVDGTPLDLRQPTPIGAAIDADDAQIRFGGGYDHNFVVRGAPGALRPAARVTEPTTGRMLEVETTQPGVQFYSGNMLPDALLGKGGQVYNKRTGFCLETQHFPDSPNKPQFPSPVLRPGERYRQTTVFRFGVE